MWHSQSYVFSEHGYIQFFKEMYQFIKVITIPILWMGELKFRMANWIAQG